ncbi:hypothetical protein WJX72_001594 [[Myrmecia] bisecta]|uniref:Tetratricopeptide repeat protein 33 n=1 Tax=[Myrmecia] bisecta TaxID=41462 RepID=A0AAW1R585_9CHLO
MSVSFGFQAKKKRKVAAPISAFQAAAAGANEEAPPVLSAEEAHAQSHDLQELGNTQAASGRHSAALQSWHRALALTPRRGVLHELKAQVLLEVGHIWDALQSATTATELEPTWGDGFLTLARTQLNFGEPEAALASMEEVLRLDPTHAEALEEVPEIRMLVLQRKQDPIQRSKRVAVSDQHSDRQQPD